MSPEHLITTEQKLARLFPDVRLTVVEIPAVTGNGTTDLFTVRYNELHLALSSCCQSNHLNHIDLLRNFPDNCRATVSRLPGKTDMTACLQRTEDETLYCFEFTDNDPGNIAWQLTLASFIPLPFLESAGPLLYVVHLRTCYLDSYSSKNRDRLLKICAGVKRLSITQGDDEVRISLYPLPKDDGYLTEVRSITGACVILDPSQD